MSDPPKVILNIGKHLDLVFTLDGKRLIIFVRWEAAERVQRATSSRLVVMRRFTPDVSDKIIQALLTFAGYDLGKRGVTGRFFSEPGKGLGIGRMRGPQGGVSLSLYREKSFDFDRLRLRLKASQVAEVCRAIAPALGWELTE